MENLNLTSRKLTKSLLLYQRIIGIIKKGGVVIFPTDTVYGFLADATNEKAVEKLFKIKKRVYQKYLPLFIKDLKAAQKIAKITQKGKNFLRKVWPGQVTVVLKRKGGLKLYGVAKETIALRIPNFKPLNQLLELINIPLTATSANISGKLPSSNIKEVLKQFENKKNKPDFIVKAGNLQKRKPSTIIDLTKRPPQILRV
ncbi:MAG: threonylcarbamoyl-AMP synthase [Parcubacteria group bacterium CG_4_9_14_0_2_um_filter_35_11]|nr:MAG: threonylcarbamoyl-AMP synthase [Parcubacteria group bacterium CG07_land_8_20_14_0_80_35_11]PJC47511.1 MAG: threonylcarbamoyl-AMP synthase [Parcubacteria group bacterium CG_4_9_14_0_2_um_filter_35_11]